MVSPNTAASLAQQENATTTEQPHNVVYDSKPDI